MTAITEFVLADQPSHPIVLNRDQEYLVVATTVRREHDGPHPASSDQHVVRHYVVEARTKGVARFLPREFRLRLLRALFNDDAVIGAHRVGQRRNWLDADVK